MQIRTDMGRPPLPNDKECPRCKGFCELKFIMNGKKEYYEWDCTECSYTELFDNEVEEWILVDDVKKILQKIEDSDMFKEHLINCDWYHDAVSEFKETFYDDA